MRTSINQGRIQSLAVMIVVLINNDQTPYLTYYRILGLTVHATSTHWFQLPSPRSPENLSVMKSSRYPVLPESFWQSHLGFHASALPGISAPLLSPKNVADKFVSMRVPSFRVWSESFTPIQVICACGWTYQVFSVPSLPLNVPASKVYPPSTEAVTPRES